MPRKRLLILGGTREARELAGHLVRLSNVDRETDRMWDVISSLAGKTAMPDLPPGTVRTGGFGGVAGLKAYLQGEHIAVVVDATHPFAAQISAHAYEAATSLGIPLFQFARAHWQQTSGDNWQFARDYGDAAAGIACGARLLLTVGRQNLEPFLARDDITIFARMIESPGSALPDHATVILARPPYSLDQERSLMERHGIDTLVTKDAGSPSVAAKIVAARERGATVIMIQRPSLPSVEPDYQAGSVEEMAAKLVHYAA